MNIRFHYRSWNSPSNVSSEKYPISRFCPKCGSGGYRLLGQSITVPFGRDRECVNCSTRYAPRQGKPAGIAFILLALFLISPLRHLRHRHRPPSPSSTHLHSDKDYQPTLGSALCPALIALSAGLWVPPPAASAFSATPLCPSHTHHSP